MRSFFSVISSRQYAILSTDEKEESIMLLTITYTGQHARDLGYLLYKHPDRTQQFTLSFGKVYVFYPEASDDRTAEMRWNG